MSSDDKGKGMKETVTDELKAVGVEVYRDAAKPVVAPIGAALGSATRLVLWPVRLALDTANAALEKLSARIEKRLEGVPLERRQLPPASLAGPAALQYALLGDGNEESILRGMFERLLASAMNRDTAGSIHPAFVTMISQMTPDEAVILKAVNRRSYAAVNVLERAPKGDHFVEFRSLFGLGLGIDESRWNQYLSNLDRLGIIRVEENPDPQDDHAELLARLEPEYPGRRMYFVHLSIVITPLGYEFLESCVKDSDTSCADAATGLDE
jgi:Abortive infection alpha